MTISEALVIIGPAAAIFVSAAIYRAYLNAQLFRLARYEEWADRFYAAAKPVIQNQDTPTQIVSLLEQLNDLITDRLSPTALVRVYTKILTRASKTEEDKKSDDQLIGYFEKHPQMASNVAAATRAGLLAASYASILNGIQARALIADLWTDLDTKKFAVRAPSDVRAVTESAHHHGAGRVPLIGMHLR